MKAIRYNIKKDWAFYLLVLGYAYLIANMTVKLWFGEGINIFKTYSDAVSPLDLIADANKVYWSKTCFLFLTILLYALKFDYRFGAGIGATFWSVSLILMFGLSPILVGVMTIGIVLIVQQVFRSQILST